MPPLREMDAPSSEVARMKGGRRGVFIAGGVALVAAAACAGYFLLRGDRGDPSKAYGELWGCMVGETLDEGESLETRFRSIHAAMDDDKADYPRRCGAALTTFHESLGGDAKTDGVREVLELEVNCKQTCSAEALVSKLGAIHDVVTSAGIKATGANSVPNPPARLAGKPLRAADFRDLVPGTVSLQGMTGVGAGKTALLYKDTVGILHLCEVEPDGDVPVRCAPLSVPSGANTARLVEGKSTPTLLRVVSMGETPEETTYGVFDAKTGAPTPDDPKEVTGATDRPRLPAPSPKWLEAELDGTKLTLGRTDNGVLRLDRTGDPPRFVMDDGDHDGPGTGNPITFVGTHRAVVLFTANQGIGALIVNSDGSVDAAR